MIPQAVSLAGSLLFVAVLGWGLAGAALTTVATQYVGALALLYALSVKGKVRGRAGGGGRGRGGGRGGSRAGVGLGLGPGRVPRGYWYGDAGRHRAWYSAWYQYVASRYREG